MKTKGIDISKYQVWMMVDNKAAVSDLRKGRSKHPGASIMADYAAKETGYTGPAVCWVNTDRMKALGGDLLSRKRVRRFQGMNVQALGAGFFQRFWKDVFGTR